MRTRSRSYDCFWLLGSLLALFVLQPYLGVLTELGIPVIRRIDSRILGMIALSLVLVLGVAAQRWGSLQKSALRSRCCTGTGVMSWQAWQTRLF